MPTARSAPLAVVTGASSGIGFELARQFAEHNDHLVVAAEDAELERKAKAAFHRRRTEPGSGDE